MNLHTPKWAPTLELKSRWTPESSRSNCKGQNLLDWKVPYIIRKLLKVDIQNEFTWPIWIIKTQVDGLCRSVWIIGLLVILHNPHHGVLTHPSTPKVPQIKERTPTPSPFVVFTFGLIVESIKESKNALKGFISIYTPLGT
jgi:hypothetical protein